MSKKPFHYEVKNQASGSTEIKMYGYIGKYEEFDYPRFQQVFRDALKDNSNLTIRMHCGGGSVYEGLAIYDLIRNSEGHTKVIVEGMAASMGGVIALAGDEIEMNDNAFFMMHAVSSGCWGTKIDFQNGLQQIENCEDRIGKIFKKRTKADDDTIHNWFNSGQDHWLDSDKCMELGICDRVIKPTKKRQHEENAQNITNKTPEEAFDCFNVYAELPKTENINQNIEMKKEALFAVLATAGLAGALTASSSDNEYETHLKDLINKAKKVDSMENELKEFKETQADALVSNALKAGKITNAEKDEWKKDAIENYALVSKSLERMSGKPDPNATVERQKRKDGDSHELLNGRENWKYSDWQEKDPKGLEKLSEEAKEEWEKLFNAEYN